MQEPSPDSMTVACDNGHCDTHTVDMRWSVRGERERRGSAVLQTDGGSDAVSDKWAPEKGTISLLPAGSYSGLCSL